MPRAGIRIPATRWLSWCRPAASAGPPAAPGSDPADRFCLARSAMIASDDGQRGIEGHAGLDFIAIQQHLCEARRAWTHVRCRRPGIERVLDVARSPVWQTMGSYRRGPRSAMAEEVWVQAWNGICGRTPTSRIVLIPSTPSAFRSSTILRASSTFLGRRTTCAWNAAAQGFGKEPCVFGAMAARRGKHGTDHEQLRALLSRRSASRRDASASCRGIAQRSSPR